MVNLTMGQSVPDASEKRVHTEVGLNMTSLITLLVPLGNQVTSTGPIDYSLKVYRKKYAFRFGLGMKVSNANENDVRLALRLGFEKRRYLSTKWAYTSGMDILAYAGTFNFPGDNNQIEGGGIGLGPLAGLEFYINSNLYLSVDSMLFFGFGAGDEFLVFRVFPPVGIFLNARF
ncbi:MAG: hypothetical protein ABIO44_09335 [Saprospiraceae bacterium]